MPACFACLVLRRRGAAGFFLLVCRVAVASFPAFVCLSHPTQKLYHASAAFSSRLFRGVFRSKSRKNLISRTILHRFYARTALHLLPEMVYMKCSNYRRCTVIYCVEDDISIRDLMIYTLKMAGFEAKGFSEAKSFYSALEEAPPELVILDIMLPGEDGISVLRRLRADSRFSSLPVIMATAKNSEYDKVVGLDLGADDYLSKPFGMLEMVSRIKAVLRRSAAKRPAGKVLGIADIRIDTDKHTVTVSGREIALTLKEYDLLKLFLENPGRVFTREQLLSAVWGTDFIGETRTVDVHIGTLRTKLGSAGDNIRTVRGVGYKIGDVV
nr:MAG TPA: response regulator [Caudoviricetes sp.]